ncbi:hypothetical protein [Portibacter lacus]|uniref:Outer membrane protein beta-barrel domain-containing protein n=1 Tax=Portibacter lacus TaxID=1099794 RepID=A0AA37SRE2_9BACT|nr:hypothetical protein [Portibacter lacus]GLR19471.1 hypothetical protein GCM10007940_40870 [Portibacter lacus]
MKKILGVAVLIIFAIMMSSTDVSAQYGKKKKRTEKDSGSRGDEKTEKVEVRTEKGTPIALEKFWFGLNVGNPFISNNIFVMGLGPMAAYKFNNIFSAGLIGDINYTLLWRQNSPNENYFDLSAGVFGRAKFFRAFYAHAEYNITSLDNVSTLEPRTNFPVLLVGGGYSSPSYTAWGYEATLLFDTLGNLGRVTNRIPITYRLGITYNF